MYIIRQQLIIKFLKEPYQSALLKSTWKNYYKSQKTHSKCCLIWLTLDMLTVPYNLINIYMSLEEGSMAQIKMDCYPPVRSMIWARWNGRQLHLSSFHEQQPPSSNINSISIFLEGILATTIALDLLNHTQMEIQAGRNFLFVFTKA